MKTCFASTHCRPLVSALCVMSLAAGWAAGDTFVWNGSGTNNLWSEAGNWNGAQVPPSGLQSTSRLDSSSGTNIMVDLPEPVLMGRLEVAGGGPAYRLSGSALQFGDTNAFGDKTWITPRGFTLNIENDLLFPGVTATNVISADSGGTLLLNGQITVEHAMRFSRLGTPANISWILGPQARLDARAVELINPGGDAANTILLRLDSPTNLASDIELRIATGGDAKARVELAFTGTQTVAALLLDGVEQAQGIYTASGHPAWFTGSGSIQVVSSPAFADIDGDGIDDA